MARRRRSDEDAILGCLVYLLLIIFLMPIAGVYFLCKLDPNAKVGGAFFYSRVLDFTGADKTERQMLRCEWHNRAMQQLQNCDIIFVDPDNGLIVPSADGTPKSNKFVLPFELSEYYRAGASVIYYQHKARRSDEFYIEQNNQLVESGGFFGAKSLGLKFRTTSQRYYFFLVQPSHAEAMVRCIEQMISTPWKNHFEIL